MIRDSSTMLHHGKSVKVIRPARTPGAVQRSSKQSHKKDGKQDGNEDDSGLRDVRSMRRLSRVIVDSESRLSIRHGQPLLVRQERSSLECIVQLPIVVGRTFDGGIIASIRADKSLHVFPNVVLQEAKMPLEIADTPDEAGSGIEFKSVPGKRQQRDEGHAFYARVRIPTLVDLV